MKKAVSNEQVLDLLTGMYEDPGIYNADRLRLFFLDYFLDPDKPSSAKNASEISALTFVINAFIPDIIKTNQQCSVQNVPNESYVHSLKTISGTRTALQHEFWHKVSNHIQVIIILLELKQSSIVPNDNNGVFSKSIKKVKKLMDFHADLFKN